MSTRAFYTKALAKGANQYAVALRIVLRDLEATTAIGHEPITTWQELHGALRDLTGDNTVAQECMRIVRAEVGVGFDAWFNLRATRSERWMVVNRAADKAAMGDAA